MHKEGLLDALAAQAPVPAVQDSGARAARGKFVVEDWIKSYCDGAKEPKDTPTGRVWVLRECPWNSDHKGSAFIMQLKDGAISAGCHHNSCREKGWPDLRDLKEPGWRERQELKAVVGRTPLKAAKKRRFADTSRYQPFPVDILPRPVQAYVLEAAHAIGCEPAQVAVPLLVCFATAIGNTRRIRLKKSWCEPCVLWAIIVAESGMQKTALDAAKTYLHTREDAELTQYLEDFKRFERDKAVYDADYAEWKKRGRRNNEPPPEKPEEPQPLRHIVTDVTVEALADRLQHAPRGLALICDELSSWLMGFNQYRAGRGGDEGHWLSMHGARPMIVDRKSSGQKTIYVPRAAVSITGTIQPGILRNVLGIDHFQNGMAARLLLCMPPRRRKRWTEATITEQIDAEMDAIFEKLLSLDFAMLADNRRVPVDLPLSTSGRAEWIRFYDEHAVEQEELAGDLAAAWSKFEGYAARLALIVHCVRWACGDRTLEDERQVDAVSIHAGVTLVRWFANEAQRVYAVMSDDADASEQRRLVELIQRKGGAITPRELEKSERRFRGRTDEAELALNDLVEQKLGTWLNGPPGAQGGRGKHVFQLSAELVVGTTPAFPAKTDGSADTGDPDTVESSSLAADVAAGTALHTLDSVSTVSAIPVVGTTLAHPEENQGSADNSNADIVAMTNVNDLLAEAAAESQGDDAWTY